MRLKITAERTNGLTSRIPQGMLGVRSSQENSSTSCALSFRGTSLRGKSPSTKIKCLESRALDWVGGSSIHGEDGQFQTALAFTGWKLLLAILKLCDLPDGAHLVRSSPVTQWSLI